LSMSNASVVEGNSGTAPMVFTATLSSAGTVSVTVNYATLNGTALSTKDYQATAGTLTFAAGQTSKTVTVLVNGDTTKESNETLTVRLSNPVNATIVKADGIGTIIDDDSTPRLKVSSTSLVEGNTGQRSATFIVEPTNGNSEVMTVDFTTIPGTAAREGIDYMPVTGTLVFPSESTDPQFITVPVIGNTRHQQTHTFNIHLLNAIQAVLDGIDGQGEIVDDDPVPTMSISDVSVGEGNSGMVNAVLTVTLSNETDATVTADYSTVDGSGIGGTDYVPASGTLTFLPGETTRVITIAINAATVGEANETFYVDLAGVSGATMLKSRGVVTITPPTWWVTSSAAEFGLGTVGAGAYLADTAGGEITLAPTVGTEFSGTALPAGWTSTVLATGGSSTVANGSIAVDGASVVAPTTYGPGRTLEFVATFSGGANQNAGLGLTSALIPPFAMFGTKTDGLLYARSVAPGQAFETPIAPPTIGSWFNTPHRFRIDYNATTVVYWIDGTQVVSHTITYPARSSSLRPAATDATLGGGALKVDWMRMSSYAASGIYTSPVFDAGASVAWQNASWVADAVAGTNAIVEMRTGSTPTPDATNWTSFRALSSGGMVGGTSRYAQYKVTLSTTVANATPAVKEVVVIFVK
jgi:Calx-beta domain